jgi:hypothetical protein
LNYIDNDHYAYAYRPLFDQSTAILLVNRQISAEAREIFHSKNEFIVIRFVGSTDQFLSKFHDPNIFPAFGQRQRIDLVDPVLNVTIQSFSDNPEDVDDDKIYTLLTTVDAIDNIFEELWDYMSDGSPGFNEIMNLTLNFQTKNSSRRKFLHEHILKPWEQVWTFQEVTLKGDIDQDLLEHVTTAMKSGLHPNDMIRYFELYQRMAEDFQKQRLYYHAGWYWNHLYWYWL